MLKSAEKTGTNEYTVEISISAEAFEKAVNKVYNKQKNSINVPGFRKGKAPRAIIEKIYGEGVFYDDAINEVFPDEYYKAVEEAGIDPVDDPRDFDLKSVGKEGVELSCKVTVRPEINVSGYKGIEAEKPAAEVTDEDIEKDLRSKQEANAREISVEGRNAENGDIATIDFEGFTDGVAFEGGKGEDYDLELGSGSFIPGFEEQIVGHAVGESFDINVKFPEEYAEELAGKDAVFKITVKGLKQKQLPELDDEFVKDVSEFDTLDELKEDIRKTLTEQKESSSKRAFENSVYDALSELIEGEIPECMYDRAVDNMISEFRYNIEAQGMPYEKYIQAIGMTEESIRAMYRPRAEKDVKIELALSKIAQLEGIEASEEDIAAEYDKMAERYGVKAEDVKAAISEDRIVSEIKARKASDMVLENAVSKKPEENSKTEE
ncbi:MAG: trigger factor [Oscillospiraceae bacterium]|nr:trigger factor [Oscillospiraceae bacterium]